MNIKNIRSGISSKNRELLGILHREAKGPFDAQIASATLNIDQPSARKLLKNLAARGWVVRLRHGWYSTVPLEASNPSQWREDPWSIASEIFAPCYIGGWTACEYWGFTDQLFNDTAVFTSRPIRERTVEINGQRFVITKRKENLLFGTHSAWRGKGKINISDPHKTLADIMDSPKMGGGIRHAIDVVSEYFESKHKNEATLIKYLKLLGNGAAFKRLGFILEECKIPAPTLLEACRLGVTKGWSLFDPSGNEGGKISRRWALRINSTAIQRRDFND